MKDIENELLECDIKTSIKLTKFIKIIKILLAMSICYAYFIDGSWLIEIIIISVVFSLILPMGFFDVFIQKLIESNTRNIERQQILNANETNNTFNKVFSKIPKIKEDN